MNKNSFFLDQELRVEKDANWNSRCGAAEANLTRNHEVEGLILGLAQQVKDPLWLWHRLAAVAPIRPLASEPPQAMAMALRSPVHKDRERFLYSALNLVH